MPSSTKSPGTLANTTDAPFSPAANAWSNPGNAAASDDSKASNVQGMGLEFQGLLATNFGFEIPDGATIDGIEVDVERSADDGVGGGQDNYMRIVKGGSIGSTDKAAGGDWPASDQVATYGGESDLWGETWTASDINASNFGFAFGGASASPAPGNVYVDHISITVYYTEAAANGDVRNMVKLPAAQLTKELAA